MNENTADGGIGTIQKIRTRLGLWLLGDNRQRIKIKDYEGSTALSVQNDRNPELHHIFYIKKWGKEGADDVVERLEGREYHFVPKKGGPK